jgi:hypothetical protein
VEEGLRTVVPHELFHLVQDAYDADVERWWAEGSAQWAAKQVYPDLQDLERFLPAYFDSPWRPLNIPPQGVITDFLYATAIWPVFLSERYDARLVRQVFESLDGGTDGVLPATDAVLQERSSSLAQEYLTFATYNAATGRRAPPDGGYAKGAAYPEVTLEPLDAAPGALVSDIASGLGAFYYSLSAASPLQLALEADATRVAAALVPLVDGKADLAGARQLPASVDGNAVLVVAGQGLSRTDAPFTVRASAANAAPESSGCSLSGVPDTEWSVSGIATALFGGWLRARKRAGKRYRKGKA